MAFEFLDSESEALLKNLLKSAVLPKEAQQGTVIENLVKLGYLKGLDVTTLSNAGPCYLLTGVTQKGKSYFELKSKHEKEQRKLSRREWKIAIISTIIGAIIGLIPSLVSWLS